MTTTVAKPLIDWATIGHIFLVSAVIAVGLVLLFSIGIISLSQTRRAGAGVLVRSVNTVVVALAAAGMLSALVWGFHFIITKK